MLFLVLLFCTEAVLGASTHVNFNETEKVIYALEDAEILFEKFILDFNKHYETEEEKLMRFEIFKHTLIEVNELNLKHITSSYGINQFSDLTKEEFVRHYASGHRSDEASPCVASPFEGDSKILKGSIDYRQRGKVTSVKNQSTCSSCWAFSIVGAVESQYAIKTGNLIDLSPQQLVDCAKNSGCDPYVGGGFTTTGGVYAMKNGLMSSYEYPYENRVGACRFNVNKVVAKPTSCLSLDGITEEGLKSALVQYGPLSIVIDASGIQSYINGVAKVCVSTGKCGHAVLLVGYNDEPGEPYWIVKNSWGSQWGEQGYIKLPMGSAACMITQCPIVAMQM